MSNALQFKYYQGGEADQFSFYRIPKALFTDAAFQTLAIEAKLLYGLLLDRIGLSTRNGWLDVDGRVYIYYTLDDAVDMMGFGHNKIVRLFRELEEIGLIERKKQGQGKPARIYVKNFVLPQDAEAQTENETSENGQSEGCASIKSALSQRTGAAASDASVSAETSQNGCSALPDAGILHFPKEAGNKNDINKTEKNYTEYPIHPSGPSQRKTRQRDAQLRMRWVDHYREQIRENIDYGWLQTTHPYDMERVDGYVELMAEVSSSSKPSVRVNGEGVPAEQARSRFLSLNREHILYVLECMDKTTTYIGNIRAYTLSALYNAPLTMEQYYASLVSRDLAEEARS